VFHAALQGAGVDVRIGHWEGRDGDHQPRYREAKKAGAEYSCPPATAIEVAPTGAHIEFHVFLSCWESHVFGIPASRAPPKTA
jgi:hypothetical protein